MKRRLKQFAPPVLWLALILTFTSLPDPPVPPITIEHLDKAVHFFMYIPLGFLLSRAMGGESRRSALIVFGICLAAAACDELHQVLIPGRSGELPDLAADVAGGAVGIGIYFAARAARRRKGGSR